ncbi:MAG: Cof-type HAD-IIB family hydrolase [Muribaculaceae bacterium]|nr:Cof-type HAD-IIB family hydrolase [Muribaculaceae bacterium]
MIKALFFDIDGTLVSFRTHRVPESAVEAISIAKSKGVEIYISTGRPYGIINNIDGIKHLVDGYITANGAYVFTSDRLISCSPICRADADILISKAVEEGFACAVVGEKDFMMYNADDMARHIFKNMLDVPDIGEDIPLEQVLSQRILQLTPIIDVVQEARILPLLQSVEASRWFPDFVDLTAKGVSKSKGLAEIAAERGFDIAETAAFGDGGNDMTMIRAAGIGVAMGNAGEELKRAADYVTTSVDDNGIYNALKHLDVI